MPFKWVLLLLIIALSGCSSIKVEPADDRWERPEEKMSGIKTGDSGWLTVFSDNKKEAETDNRSTQASAEKSTVPANSERSEFNEFREWQNWQDQKKVNSPSYLEFQQWIRFQSLKSQH